MIYGAHGCAAFVAKLIPHSSIFNHGAELCSNDARNAIVSSTPSFATVVKNQSSGMKMLILPEPPHGILTIPLWHRNLPQPKTVPRRESAGAFTKVSQYQEIAYRKLGLSAKGHEIGTTRYIDLPEDALLAICVRRLNTVWKILHADQPPKTEDRQWCKDVRINYFLLYREWLHLLKSIRSYEPEDWRYPNPDPEERRKAVIECYFKYRLYKGGRYEPTFEGWKRYLRDASPGFYKYLVERTIPVRVDAENLTRHVFICASSGSGKSELCKIFCHSYREHPEYGALMVLDPGGDFATEFAMAARTDRLIYVHPLLDLEMSPTINPFEITRDSPRRRLGRGLGGQGGHSTPAFRSS
jgi:hypothetical protein